MTDRYPKNAIQRRSSAVATRPRSGVALERKTVAVYDTVTEGMTGLEFVRTKRWIGYIVAALVFAIVCGVLSHWQFDRGHQADAYNRIVETNFDAAPVPLASVLPTLSSYDAANNWKRITATGTYLASEQLYVRTRPHSDSIGFEVLTPLQLADGSKLVVDRGWVASRSDDTNRPVAAAAPPRGTVTVTARIEPGEGTRGSIPSIKNQIESIDLPQVKQRIGGQVYTGAYALLQSQTPAPATSLTRVVTEPPTQGTAIHWSYMIQWVLIAGIGVWGLYYGIRTEFRRLNADDPAERARAAERLRKAATKRFTDAEVEDEILDGFVSLRRWGLQGAVAVGPASGPRVAIGEQRSLGGDDSAPAAEDGARTANAPKGPDIYVIRPRDDEAPSTDSDQEPSQS